MADPSPWELTTLESASGNLLHEHGTRASLTENKMASTRAPACMATGSKIPFATLEGVKNRTRTYFSQWSQI